MGSLGWFERLGFFGSWEKLIQERAKLNPHYLRAAYAPDGDIFLRKNGEAIWPIDPKILVARLATEKHRPENDLFFPSQVSGAILSFNLAQGNEALSLANCSSILAAVARKRLFLAAEMGSPIA